MNSANTKGCVLAALVVLVIAGVTLNIFMSYMFTGYPPWFGARQIIMRFADDKEALNVVRDYLARADCDDISITNQTTKHIWCASTSNSRS